MLKYTICFIKKGNEILLLNRMKSPNMGMWNGVGGKIEDNESAMESVIRETFEETGIALETVIHAGDVTWKSNRGDAGMRVFVAELPSSFQLITPVHTCEGILDWKSIDWIMDQQNKGVVDNIKIYLPKMLEGQYGWEYQFIYEDGVMLEYKVLTRANSLS